MAFGAFQSSAPAGPPVATAQVQRKSPVALWLLLPGILYLVLFFVTPLFSLVITSFEEPVPGGFLGEFQTGFRWENYVEVVSTYFSHIGRSFLYASLATIFALLLGYPIAYVIGVKLRPYPLAQALALVLLIAPFFISFLLRTLAWKQIFSDEGFVVATLKTFQLIPSDAYLTGTPFSVVFGLTYMFFALHGLADLYDSRKARSSLCRSRRGLIRKPFYRFHKNHFSSFAPRRHFGNLIDVYPRYR